MNQTFGQGQDNLGLFDILTLLSFMIQIVSYEEIKAQASTDDIFKELQKQDREYLSKILENQKMILERLADLSAKND